jgi:tRNA1Val (adenine37-N6)-methyltransferase
MAAEKDKKDMLSGLGEAEHWEPLGPSMKVLVNQNHRFNTDTILLAHFSMPGRGELCADFGTGCGTIPLLWCGRSNPQKVWGVELQEDAAGLAEKSIQFNNLQLKIEILQNDIKNRQALRQAMEPGSLHRIACNPPYTPEGKGGTCPEGSRLLARHQVACSFSDIAREAAFFLRWGGKFCCCQRPEHLASVIASLQREGLEPKRLRFVQQRREKAPFLFLLEASRGGNPGMRVLPVLFVEDSNGGLSQEMLDIYGSYKSQ